MLVFIRLKILCRVTSKTSFKFIWITLDTHIMTTKRGNYTGTEYRLSITVNLNVLLKIAIIIKVNLKVLHKCQHIFGSFSTLVDISISKDRLRDTSHSLDRLVQKY